MGLESELIIPTHGIKRHLTIRPVDFHKNRTDIYLIHSTILYSNRKFIELNNIYMTFWIPLISIIFVALLEA